jgi:hypothetical protein
MDFFPKSIDSLIMKINLKFKNLKNLKFKKKEVLYAKSIQNESKINPKLTFLGYKTLIFLRKSLFLFKSR